MTNPKPVPFNDATIRAIAENFPTPFYLYDEQGIRDSCRQLKSAFSWVDGFRNYFAVKATPNPHILSIVTQEGLGGDCSSKAELIAV